MVRSQDIVRVQNAHSPPAHRRNRNVDHACDGSSTGVNTPRIAGNG
jgi:hypothetical protein